MDKKKWANDEQFKQEAWEQMAQVLDQEMPVEKKKKRSLLFFLCGIGFLVLATLVFYINNNKTDKLFDKNSAPISQQVEKQIALPSAIQTETLETNETLIGADQLEEKTISTKNDLNQQSTIASFNKFDLVSNSKSQKDLNEVTSNHTILTTPNQHQFVDKEIQNKSTTIYTSEPIKTLAKKSESTLVPLQKSLAYISLLPIDVDLFEIKPINLDIPFGDNVTPTIAACGFKKDLDFIIGAHLVATRDTEFYGYGAHLGLDYQFAERFSIRSMVASQRLNAKSPYEFTQDALQSGDASEMEITEGFDFSKLNVDEISKYSETTHLANLTLGYHINKQFSFFSGFQFRYFTGTRQEFLSSPSGLSEEFIGIFSEMDVDPNSSVANLEDSSGIFLREKKLFNPMIGINYCLKNIESSLSYEYSLKGNYKNLLNGESSSKLSYLQLNLSARF